MKLYLNFHEFAKTGSGTWVDYSEALLEGFTKSFGASRLRCRPVSMLLNRWLGLPPLAVNILTATNDIRAKLPDNTPRIFGNHPDRWYPVRVREVIKPISVEILDDTHFLESYIFAADAPFLLLPYGR